MAAYLITYDLHAKEYEQDLLDYIKVDPWWLVAESSYVVVRRATPGGLVTAIRAIVHDKIELLVVTVSKPFSSHGLTPELVVWLNRHLPGPRSHGP